MKTKILFFGCFLFGILFLLPFISVNADPSHQIAVKEGDEFVYNAKLVNENELEDIYGVNWDTLFFFSGLETGTKMKINFTNIDLDYIHPSTNHAFLYGIDIYQWSTNISSDIIQYSSSHYLYHDPADFTTLMRFTNVITFLFPTPIKDALGDYDDEFMPSIYTFVDNLIVVQCEIGEIDALEQVRWLAEYNEKGVPSSIKIFNKVNDLIVDIELVGSVSSSIPGFELGMILVVILIPTITLLLRIQRRRIK